MHQIKLHLHALNKKFHAIRKRKEIRLKKLQGLEESQTEQPIEPSDEESIPSTANESKEGKNCS